MVNSLMSSTTNKPTGRAKSCVGCRQFKLACDARRTAPDPCSRCVDKALHCRFDPNFKRVSTRKITQEVTQELHALRRDAAVSELDITRSPAVRETHSPLPPGRSRRSPSSIFQHPAADASTKSLLNLSEDELIQDRSLHSFSLSSNRILKFFHYFDQHFYPHARFLQPITSINALAEKCPLLFWTILLISADRWPGEDGGGTYYQLSAINDSLIGDVLHKAIQDLSTLHALLLLCLYPIPKLRNAHDPSWNYIGLCVQAAQTLDCHNPQLDTPMKHYRGWADTAPFEMSPEIQAMTWLECFLTGARLGTISGFVGPISLPQHTKSIQRARKLASNLLRPGDHAALDLWQIFVSAQVALDNIGEWSTHCTVTQIFEQQIDNIKIRHAEGWSTSLEAQIQGAKMYLLGMTLTLDLPSDNQLPQAIICRNLALERSMGAAQAYISAITSLSDQEVPSLSSASGYLTFHPKYLFVMLMGAACYLFRFLVSYQGATQSQQALVIQRMTQAHRVFQSFPEHRDAVRACIMIEMLVGRLKLGNTQDIQGLAIKTRLGASVVSDALFRAAEVRQRDLAPLSQSDAEIDRWKLVHEDTIHSVRLPLAPSQRVTIPPAPMAGSPYSGQIAMTSVPGVSAMGIWDAYSDNFGMMNEPWMENDAEFAGIQQAYLQQSYPGMPDFDINEFQNGLSFG